MKFLPLPLDSTGLNFTSDGSFELKLMFFALYLVSLALILSGYLLTAQFFLLRLQMGRSGFHTAFLKGWAPLGVSGYSAQGKMQE